MADSIAQLAHKHAAAFSEERFLELLSRNLPESCISEIVERNFELRMSDSLGPEDLRNPLKLRSFPVHNCREVAWVLRDSILGARLFGVFGGYQRVYIAALYLHCFRSGADFLEVSDDAVALAVDAALDCRIEGQVRESLRLFLFSLCRFDGGPETTDGCTFFSLLGILLLCLWENEEKDQDLEAILGFLFDRPERVGIVPRTDNAECIPVWHALAEKALSDRHTYREEVELLLTLIPE